MAEIDDNSCILLNEFIGSGDVNEDGIVNIEDIILIVSYILNEISIIELTCEANLSSDSNIDIFDIILIINSILEI